MRSIRSILRQNESLYYPLKKVCLSLGMEEQEFTDFIDYQIMTDYLITNTDRHMNNIAVMRNPDTLALMGFAPIFDSGNSMFYNVPYEKLSKIKLDEIKTHSFIEKELIERQIRTPKLKELYQRKRESLREFQKGKNIWKSREYMGQ